MNDRIDGIMSLLIEQADARSEGHAETMRQLGDLQGTLKTVLEEARRTNGRVTKLESEAQELRQKQWYLVGGCTAAVAVIEFFKDKILK